MSIGFRVLDLRSLSSIGFREALLQAVIPVWLSALFGRTAPWSVTMRAVMSINCMDRNPKPASPVLVSASGSGLWS